MASKRLSTRFAFTVEGYSYLLPTASRYAIVKITFTGQERILTREEKIKYWVDLSNNDFTVAETLIKNGHNLYAGFMCHQAVEKMLKGYFVKVKNDTPPFKHDLEYLALQSDLYNLLNEKHIFFLETLNPLNIEARYPDYKNKTAQYLTNERTQSIFEQTKELLQWIKEKI